MEMLIRINKNRQYFNILRYFCNSTVNIQKNFHSSLSILFNRQNYLCLNHNCYVTDTSSVYYSKSSEDTYSTLNDLYKNLRHQKTEAALQSIETLHKAQVELKTHYFWPLIIQIYGQCGEIGVMKIIETMLRMDITIDHETLVSYICPRIDLTNPLLAIRKLQDRQMKIQQILSPICISLLKQNSIDEVNKLCFERFPDSKIYNEDFISSLIDYYINTKDIENTLALIRRTNNQTEACNIFLVKISQNKNPLLTVEKVQVIISEFLKSGFLITEDTKYDLISYFSKHKLLTSDFTFYEKSKKRYLPRLDVDRIAVPLSDLSVSDLECRVRPDDVKSVSALVHLFLKHCQRKSYDKAMEIHQELLKYDVKLSPGILSTSIDMYVYFKEPDKACDMISHLKLNFPSFNIDLYKIIDLAKLYIEQNEIQKAITIIDEHHVSFSFSKIKVKYFERNCKELLSIINNEQDLITMFNLLMRKQICNEKSTNIFSTIIRYFLNRNDTSKACEYFELFNKKYRKTPMKYEILCALLIENNFKQIDQVLEIIRNIHGVEDQHVTYIKVLCDMRYINNLELYINNNVKDKVNQQSFIIKMKKEIQRLSDENKSESLLILSKIFKTNEDLIDDIFLNILNIYCRQDNLESIKQLTTNYENIRTPSNEFINMIKKKYTNFNS